MKKSILSIIVVCLLPQIFKSQTTTQNFVKKTIPIEPVTTEASLNALSSSYKIESINYIDGLGRSIQNVLVKGSPFNYDIVQPIIYDAYGRQSKTYLSYVDPTNDASYKTNAISNQLSFYTNKPLVAKTTSPFSEQYFDGSPLNNVIEKTAPDTDWQLGNGHTTKLENSFNTTSDGIIDWVLQTNGDYWFEDGHIYAPNTLSVSKLLDANGNYSFVYKDKQGKTICVKQFLEMRTVNSQQVPYYLTTYMLYDDFGQLIIIVPPKAIDVMAGAGNYSVNFTEDLVFRYKYDERHRLIEQKTPGTGWSYTVYNQLNQPVLFQDANLQAQNRWNFIKYDIFNRPIMSGLFNATGLANFQTRALAQTQFNTSIYGVGESEVLLDINNPYGYTNVTLPNQNLDILTVNYYDDYDFDNNGAADYTFNSTAIPCLLMPNGIKGGGGLSCQPYTNALTNRTRGYLTGSRVKVLDVGNLVQWEIGAVFYDNKGQTIQSQSNDHMGGTDLVNMVYDWAGNVIHTQQLHTSPSQSNLQVLNHMYYDKMGRLIQVEQKNNSDAAVILANYNYNELSQLVGKNIHRISTAATAGYLQSIDYRYNIHGWLTSINNIDLINDMGTNPLTGTNDDTNDLWGMELNYNTNTLGVNGTKQYTGNVAEKKWRSITDNTKRAYGYDYDKAERLKSSLYSEYGSVWTYNGKYDEKNITYDSNGNILTLERKGAVASAYPTIDNLTYGYNGNFLTRVNDAATTNGSLDFHDNGSTSSNCSTCNEYTYDGNGNKLSDVSKGITSIIYNHLNLPTQINFSGAVVKKIEYTYDASGTRLRKKVTDGSIITIKNYVGIFEYIDNNGSNVLESMHTSEGRCVPTSSTPQFRYEYQYTDNTGNVMMAFSDVDNNGSINTTTEVIQQSHYYAFGMRMEGTGVSQIGAENKYKFSGKELNDDLGLNEYDFGARFYDPAIARWGGVDPMADATPNMTPFHYCNNNPINYTDPTGMYAGVSTLGVEDNQIDAMRASGSSTVAPTFKFVSNGDGGGKWVLNNPPAINNAPKETPSNMQSITITSTGATSSVPDLRPTISQGSEQRNEMNRMQTAFSEYGGDGSGSFSDNAMFALDVVRDFSPLTKLNDAFSTWMHGTDSRGIRQNNIDGAYSAIAGIPFVAVEEAIALRISRSFRGFQNHHIIPNEIYNKYKTQFDDIGWNQNHAFNMKKLPAPFHGNHPAYNKFVQAAVADLQKSGVFNMSNMQQLQNQMRQTINKIYTETQHQRMNQYFKYLGY